MNYFAWGTFFPVDYYKIKSNLISISVRLDIFTKMVRFIVAVTLLATLVQSVRNKTENIVFHIYKAVLENKEYSNIRSDIQYCENSI